MAALWSAQEGKGRLFLKGLRLLGLFTLCHFLGWHSMFSMLISQYWQAIKDVVGSPGLTALQLKLHPFLVPLWSVVKSMLMTLLVLEMLVGIGRELPLERIKTVPSPSVIFR